MKDENQLEDESSEERVRLEKRLNSLLGMGRGVEEKIKNDEAKWEEVRAKLLGVNKKAIAAFKYSFPLTQLPVEKEEVVAYLNSLGEQRYKDGRFKVFVNDNWTDFSVSLRWPFHYAGWIDNVTLFSSSGLAEQISVSFMRPKKSDHDPLYKEAQKIYEALKSKLG